MQNPSCKLVKIQYFNLFDSLNKQHTISEFKTLFIAFSSIHLFKRPSISIYLRFTETKLSNFHIIPIFHVTSKS